MNPHAKEDENKQEYKVQKNKVFNPVDWKKGQENTELEYTDSSNTQKTKT